MITGRPSPLAPLLTGVMFVPLVQRASTQGLFRAAVLTGAVPVLILMITSGRRRVDWAVAATAALVLGLVVMVPSLAVFAGACVAAVGVALRPPAHAWTTRPLAAWIVLFAGAVAAHAVLLATVRVAIPIAVLAAGVAGSMAVEHRLVSSPPGPLDGRFQTLLRRWGGRWDRTGAVGDPGRGAEKAGAPSDRPRPAVAVVVVGAILGALVWSGRSDAALASLAAMGVVLLGVWYFPSLRRALGGVFDAVAAALSRVVTVVVLFPVYALVVTPVGLVRRAFRRPLLDLGWGGVESSYWLEHRSGGGESLDSMFANERAWGPTAVPGPSRQSTVVRTVAAVLAVQLVALGAYWAWDRRTSPVETFSGASAIGSAGSPAVESSPWAVDVMGELGAATQGIVYTPYTGWSLRDFEGRYVNVENRARASYEPPVPAGVDPVDIWFFGGSTMFGYDALRDEHTIPSEVARLAEAEGLPVRVRNYGAPGYVNYQSAVLLSLLLTGGELPDLVVFYDGINDSSTQLLGLFAQLNPSGEPTDVHSQILREAVATADIVPGMSAEPPAPLTAGPEEPVTLESSAGAIVDVYEQGIELARALSDRFGVPVLNYWQPDAFSKSPLDPAENRQLGDLGFGGDVGDGMRRLSTAVRAELDPDVHDLSAALDETDGPVLTDIVHVNEEGAAAVADKMYATLSPQIRLVAPPA